MVGTGGGLMIVVATSHAVAVVFTPVSISVESKNTKQSVNSSALCIVLKHLGSRWSICVLIHMLVVPGGCLNGYIHLVILFRIVVMHARNLLESNSFW